MATNHQRNFRFLSLARCGQAFTIMHTGCGNSNGNGRMSYTGPYGSVYMETSGNGTGNPWGPIESILSVTIAAVSVYQP